MFRYFAGFALLSLTVACVEAPPSSDNVVPTNNSSNPQSNNSNNPQSNNSSNNASNNSSNNASNNSSNNASNNTTVVSCEDDWIVPGKLANAGIQVDYDDRRVLVAANFSRIDGAVSRNKLRFGVFDSGGWRLLPMEFDLSAHYDVALADSEELKFVLVRRNAGLGEKMTILNCDQDSCSQIAESDEANLSSPLIARVSDGFMVGRTGGSLGAFFFEAFHLNDALELGPKSILLEGPEGSDSIYAQDMIMGETGVLVTGQVSGKSFMIVNPVTGDGSSIEPMPCGNVAIGTARAIRGEDRMVTNNDGAIKITNCASETTLFAQFGPDFDFVSTPTGGVASFTTNALGGNTLQVSVVQGSTQVRRALGQGHIHTRIAKYGEEFLIFAGSEDEGLRMLKGTPEQLAECGAPL